MGTTGQKSLRRRIRKKEMEQPRSTLVPNGMGRNSCARDLVGAAGGRVDYKLPSRLEGVVALLLQVKLAACTSTVLASGGEI